MLERDRVGGSWDFTPLLKSLVHNYKVTAYVAHLLDPHFHLRKRSAKESCNKPRYMWVLHELGAPWTEVYVGAPWTGCSMD